MGSDGEFLQGEGRVSGFNSRSRMGSDVAMQWVEQAAAMFQFALPHGERPRRSIQVDLRRLFQFALPHGERRKPLHRSRSIRWFQFALPHGERQT